MEKNPENETIAHAEDFEVEVIATEDSEVEVMATRHSEVEVMTILALEKNPEGETIALVEYFEVEVTITEEDEESEEEEEGLKQDLLNKHSEEMNTIPISRKVPMKDPTIEE